MAPILRALGRAFASLAHPKMIRLMVWPLALALAFWVVVAVLFGAQTVAGIQGWLSTNGWYASFIATSPWSMIAAGLLWILGILLFVPLVLITASLIIGIFSMPVLVNHVASRDFPAVERKHGGGVAGSVWNAFVALARLVLLAIITIPAWFFPPLWPVILIVLFGYFNQRLFRYDALAEHGTPDEIKAIVRTERSNLWILGLLLAVIGHVPLLGFFMPVWGGLAFAYFLLEALQAKRRAAGTEVA